MAGPQTWLTGPQAWLDGPEGGGTDKQMNGRKIYPLYRTLSPFGAAGVKKVSASTKITTDEFRNHFSKVSQDSLENPREEIDRAVDDAEDLLANPRTEGWRISLNAPPEREEVLSEMGKMRAGALGDADRAGLRKREALGLNQTRGPRKLLKFNKKYQKNQI